MPQPPWLTRKCGLFAMDGIFGRLQFVTSDRRVLIDLCADLYDVDGFPRRERAVTSLSIADAKRAYSLLGRAIDVAETTDERQPGLWGDATHAVPVRPTHRLTVRPKLRSVRAGREPRSISAHSATVG